MPTILFEILYTIWPVFAWLAAAPLFLVIFILSALSFLTAPMQMLDAATQQVATQWTISAVYAMFFTPAFITLAEFISVGWRKVDARFHVPKYFSSKKTRFLAILMLWLVLTVITHTILSWVSFESLWESKWVLGVFIFCGVFGIVGVLRYVVLWLASRVERLVTLPILQRPVFQWIGRGILFFLVLYPFLAGVGAVAWFFLHENPGASRFHVLHAAIKNTCLIDPNQENCPQTVEEIGYIEPRAYVEATECCQIQYVYDEQTNLYTLVVRYSPTQAAVFDQRLVAETGLDFAEYTVLVFGQDRLKNAPEWLKFMEFPDWEYTMW